MSHTFKHGEDWFIFNSDLSGPVTVCHRNADGSVNNMGVSGPSIAAFIHFLATDLWSDSDKSFVDQLAEVKKWGDET